LIDFGMLVLVQGSYDQICIAKGLKVTGDSNMMLLIIRDGWGVNDSSEGNAVQIAKPQCYQRLLETSERTTLEPGGEAVGLPPGQMGNSEVGHMNIGAGRVVYQDLPKITKSFEEGKFVHLPVIANFLLQAQKSTGRVHLMGLFSDGGVHSHQDHFIEFLKVLKQEGIEDVFLHTFLDGRDTAPKSALGYLQNLEEQLKQLEIGKVATISGRYYAMDRDKNWDRTKKAYDAMVRGEGLECESVEQALLKSYEEGQTDEFVLPTVVDRDGLIQDGDSVFFMNFRPDRARQMSFAIENNDFQDFEVESLDLNFAVMTPYSSALEVPVAFPKDNLKETLSEVISKLGKKQLKIAETEKYAHVTYFLNGGNEDPFEGEDWVLIPSPKVETYDLKPEMSAPEVTQKLEEAILSQKYELITVNYANPDMVGHTGNLDAAVEAVKVVDECIERLLKALEKVGGQALITADHGNLDEMVSPEDGSVLTNHSLNPVDLIYVPNARDEYQTSLRFHGTGKLADIAPTLLTCMKIDVPESMDGEILLR